MERRGDIWKKNSRGWSIEKKQTTDDRKSAVTSQSFGELYGSNKPVSQCSTSEVLYTD